MFHDLMTMFGCHMFRDPILGGLLGFLVCWGNMFTQIGGRVGYMAQL